MDAVGGVAWGLQTSETFLTAGGSDRGSSEALMRTLFRVADACFSVFSIHSDGGEKELSGDFFFFFNKFPLMRALLS